ncbi:hypothetical protein MBM_02855 [Drepanopeziza brunnea f. sp. 'multigermtubi' MB_m1]|uniref:Chromo domain-containing protein n=1 Tax=Marssonina brunnea f. sp. multigermtubi (strain MB_m1) TaxID=1072389 RepID=K1XCW8_MARBU|nr:uncharacterized protein MBM_02855 [Drepanopeziza brunnea f. sp. 'multigermtubi' MB_m1]EKD18613.1 hypothetical protein MBM_02855 [Drepanopeziza brunnea f. sp. 'multigermtubi' MB_m1]
MAPAELNYVVHDKEMLAIIRSFSNFRAELAGSLHQVQVITDHKALNELEYEVENILAVRQTKKHFEYRASWLGRDIDLIWYPASDFMYAPFKVRDFHLEHKELPGPPAKLFDWIKAYSDGVDDYDHLSSDKAMDGRSRTSFFRTGG